MKTLLFASHTPSANTEKLATICAAEMLGCSEDITVIHKPSLEIASKDGLACDGLVIATTENIGYMAGATKDMFDRCYNDWLGQTEGLAVGVYIRAGLDGTATRRALEGIIGAQRWRLVAPPLILHGDWSDAHTGEVEELAMAMAAGLDAGIF